MPIKKIIMLFPVLISLVSVAAAQNQPQNSSKTIQHVAMKPTSSASGEEMYTSYCAVCHGKEGRGDGPAASALKVAPADLTVLSKNDGGKYPALKVSSAIRGTANLPAHGSEEMPMWGDLFRGISNGHEGEVQQRIGNLTHYIETLQTK